MRTRFAHRDSPFFAFTAWLCLALHLAVFTASGWHFHGPLGHTHGPLERGHPGHTWAGAGGGHAQQMCCSSEHEGSKAERDGPSAADGDADKRHDQDSAPRDGHDPHGCGLCAAILALHHATLAPPVALIVVPTEISAELPVRAQAVAVAPQRRQWSRGPPMTGS